MRRAKRCGGDWPRKAWTIEPARTAAWARRRGRGLRRGTRMEVRLGRETALHTYIGLLRAVNVGGTGKLPMAELKAMCEAEGFERVKTYIASGNVVFTSRLKEKAVKAALEARLADCAGKPVGVMVRTVTEMSAVEAANPFKVAPGNRVVAIFLDEAPAKNALADVKHQATEELRLGKREIYVRYD